ncbi:MAG TPA: PAS domain S-box protein [Armatimonadota bacterium]|jgi:diguanylate cyclase (GGDEF)-like protein/PAS domain S-box-containing protein
MPYDDCYRSLFENSAIGLYRIDGDGRLLAANAALAHILGHASVPSLLSATEQTGIAGRYADPSALAEFQEIVVRDGSVHGFQTVWLRSDGAAVSVRESARAVFGADGAILYCDGTVEDVTDCAAAQAAVQSSEGAFRMLAENALDVVSRHGPDLRFLYVSRASAAMASYPPSALIGAHPADFVHPDDLPILQAAEATLSAEGTVSELEYRFRRADGSYIWVETSASALRDPVTQEVVEFHVITRDISRRKQVEEEKRNSEERFRSLIEGASDVVTVLDAHGMIQYVGPSVRSILGYDPEAVVGQIVKDFIHPDDHALFRSALAEFMERPDVPLVREIRVRRSDGAWRWMEASGRNLLAHPSVNGIIVNARDITDRRGATGFLRESEDRFRGAFDDAPIGVALMSLDGYWLRVNRALCGILGYSEEDLMGCTWADMSHPDDCGVEQIRVDQLIAGEVSSLHVEKRYVHCTGRTIWVWVNITLVHTPEGRPDYLLAHVQDITEGKSARDALQASEERLQALLENSSDAISIVDASGAVVYESPSVQRQLGLNPVMRVRQKCFEFVHPDDLESVSERFSKLVSSPGGVDRMIVRLRHSDGAYRTLEVTGHNELRNPAVQGIILNSRDVTDERAAVESLKESEAHFRGMFESAPIGLALVATSGHYIRVNRSLCRMLGYTEEELVGIHYDDITYPEDRPGDAENTAALVEGGRRVAERVKRYVRKDGSLMWATLSLTAIRDEAGRPAHFLSQIQDISEARRAEEALRNSEARFREVWESSSEGLRLLDADGIVVMVNDAYCRMVGFAADQMVGRAYADVYECNVVDAMAELRGRVAQRDIVHYGAADMAFTSGRVVSLEVNHTLIEAEGRAPMVLSTFRDITERKRSEAALARYRLLAEHSNDIMLFIDANGTIIEANAAAERSYGYPHDEIVGMSIRDLRATGDESPLLRQVAAGDFSPQVFQSLHRRKDGSTFPAEVSIQSASTGENRVVLAVARDTTERAAFEEQLTHQAFHDPLTGLPNRALFMDRLEHALTSSSRRQDGVGVLFLDVDRFKIVNDSLGHPAGDQLLVAIAGRLKACIRAMDTAARFGGDEFTILLEGISTEGEASMSADRIIRRLEAPFEIAGQEVFMTASVGVAVSLDGSARADDMVRDADIAMYEAKSGGRAKHAVSHRAGNGEARERLQLETDLRRAIERNEFQVYYQPIVLLDTQRTIGVEALVRWQHPRFGLMPPDEFVPVQEQIGLIEPFTMWVLNEAQSQCLKWQRAGKFLNVSVNLSVQNLHEPRFAERVAAGLQETGLSPGSLKLEITESAVMINPPRAMQILGDLSGMGVRLSLDDFGTGYSSLTYLKQLPVHEIKIDKSFVLGMDENDDDDSAIVRATIELAHNLRKKVVAEGVESQSVWALLKLLGCDAAQGYYMGRPMPVDELDEWLITSEFGLHM